MRLNRNRRLAIALIAITLIVVPAGAASASLDTEPTHGTVGSFTQLYTSKSGAGAATIGEVRVGHFHNAWGSICDVKSKVYGTLSNGNAYSYTFGYSSGCAVFPNVLQTTNINKTFKKGTYVRGQNFHDLAWAPGTPGTLI